MIIRKILKIYIQFLAIEVNDTVKQEKIISSIYEEYKDKEIDAIVLGCTHYPHIKPLINKYMYCWNCGAEVSDNAVVCVNCGCEVGQPKKKVIMEGGGFSRKLIR